MRRERFRKGFTLIELLIVVAIIGIIVAIVMINLINAIERTRQRRTMADMRSVGTALESYATDRNQYPPSAAFVLPAGLPLPTKNLVATATYLQPTYIKVLPLTDGWMSWFGYEVSTRGTDYLLASSGRDGFPESAPSFGPTTNFNADIIYCNGVFVQYPEGIQN